MSNHGDGDAHLRVTAVRLPHPLEITHISYRVVTNTHTHTHTRTCNTHTHTRTRSSDSKWLGVEFARLGLLYPNTWAELCTLQLAKQLINGSVSCKLKDLAHHFGVCMCVCLCLCISLCVKGGEGVHGGLDGRECVRACICVCVCVLGECYSCSSVRVTRVRVCVCVTCV